MFLIRGLLLLCLATAITAQRSSRDELLISQSALSKSAEEFSLDLFERTAKAIQGRKYNLMISPFTVWALLLLIAEGSDGETRDQLLTALRIQNTRNEDLRSGFTHIQDRLTVNTTTVEVSASQAIFYNEQSGVYPSYIRIIEGGYKAQLQPVNFQRVNQALQIMTDYITRATRGLIQPALHEDDVKEAQLVMISSIFFKGAWKYPFDSQLTKEEPFFDDDENPIGTCQMMSQAAAFNYAPIVEMQSHVVELPYGAENRLSMLIIFPKKGTRLVDAIANLNKIKLDTIFAALKKNEANLYPDENEVEVFLPKFTTTTSLVMNSILENMNILDVFDPDRANLKRLSSQPLHLSRVIHQTKIEVNEEGTVAAAVTTGTFANKASPPRFYLNRPFAYLIVEKETKSLLFCGLITKPNNNN